ncbi:hypothetical protein LJC57_06275 [Parabacteroides sp. OttesenSCG-928-G07]|nr:hypothetical protein [Parabacteroides sp. OttesenSCG-928-G21]MDL2278182.1 hypothetical protein [Parabacteroides sp. OttesenSCG-928-G07]
MKKLLLLFLSIMLVGCGGDSEPEPESKPVSQLSLDGIGFLFFDTKGNAINSNTFTITSNTEWTISSTKDWCTFTPSSGKGNKEVKISPSKNDSFDMRTASITVKAGNRSHSFSIYQLGFDLPDNILAHISDPILKSYIIDNFDSDKNGLLSIAEVFDVTEINIEGKNITSLSGIENFFHLNELDCTNNRLSELDLTKNTQLNRLDCDDNELTKLILPKNAKITFLACSSNKLTTIDLSAATELTFFSCEINPLSKLDLSENRKLKLVYCSNNLLNSINISTCTELTDLRLRDNKLTSIDISANTELKELDLYANLLTSIDISKNTKLKVLDCQHNPIEKIYVWKDFNSTNPEQSISIPDGAKFVVR